MKILLLGNFGKGALENSYLNGLKENGETPEVFEITKDYYETISAGLINKIYNKIDPAHFFKTINKKTEAFIFSKQFDVILVFKGLSLFPETIRLLKEHASVLACYNPDHPYTFYSEGSGNTNILKSISYYDLYFTYSESIRQGLESQFSAKSYVIPFGFDDKQTMSSRGEDLYQNSWLMMGSYDKERARFLLDLDEENVKVYGELKWGTRNKSNKIGQKYFQGTALYEEAYHVAIAGASGVLNPLRKQNLAEQSHNMRTFEVPGFGGLLISERTKEQLSFFTEETEAIYFDSVPELKDKINYLEKHPEKIAAIKTAAYKRAISSGYTYRDRCSQLLVVLKKYLRQ